MILSLGLSMSAMTLAAGASVIPTDALDAPTLWGLSAVAAAAYLAAFAYSDRADRWATKAMTVGWLAHALALAYDIFGTGQGARFGFAPALSATIWLVIAAHAAEQRSMVMAAARRALALSGVVVCGLAAAYPGEVRAAESPWAPLHWLLGIVSYGLLGAAVVHAWLLSRAESRMRLPRAPEASAAANPARAGMPLLMLERLTFRFVDAGFVVLTITLLLGGWFALQAAGWRWDHKTVFSLAGWLTFALLVAGRHAYGWRGKRATRYVYVGAVLLLLAYVGSRFVLEVLLARSS